MARLLAPPTASGLDVFVDTSALFAGIWSPTGGGRLVLKLGEAGAIQLWASSQVLTELERTVRQKAPEKLRPLALMLDRSRVRVAPSPPAELVERCRGVVLHDNDSLVIAAAWHAQVHFMVTLDRVHMLDNAKLRALLPLPLGTPGDFLAWYRARSQQT